MLQYSFIEDFEIPLKGTQKVELPQEPKFHFDVLETILDNQKKYYGFVLVKTTQKNTGTLKWEVYPESLNNVVYTGEQILSTPTFTFLIGSNITNNFFVKISISEGSKSSITSQIFYTKKIIEERKVDKEDLDNKEDLSPSDPPIKVILEDDQIRKLPRIHPPHEFLQKHPELADFAKNMRNQRSPPMNAPKKFNNILEEDFNYYK